MERRMAVVLFALCVTAVYIQPGSTQLDTQPRFTCNALQNLTQSGTGYNPDFLDYCHTQTTDTSACTSFFCNDNNSTLPFARVNGFIMPCKGDNHMTPGILLTIEDINVNPIIDMVFVSSKTVDIPGMANTLLGVTVTQMDSGIIFALGVTVDGVRTDVLYEIRIPIDSTRFTCPGIPPPTPQPEATCAALRTISQATPSEIFGSCAPDLEYCTNMRCTRADQSSFQLSVVSIFPCTASGPTVRAFFADSELQAQINITVNQTTNNIPFHNSALGFLNIRMEVNSNMTSVNLGMVWILVAGETDGTTYIPFTQIPINRTLCPDLLRPEIRLAGGTSSHFGRLEVRLDGIWGTVCDKGTEFTKTEADIACRQLQGGIGKSVGHARLPDISFVPSDTVLDNTLPIAIRNVSCSSQSILQDCIFKRNAGACSHQTDDVGLSCSTCSLYLCDDGECVNGAACVQCKDHSDEGACGANQAFSLSVKIGIAVVLLLIVAIPAICIYVCICCAIKKSGRSAPKSSAIVTTAYQPVPNNLV